MASTLGLHFDMQGRHVLEFAAALLCVVATPRVGTGFIGYK